LLHASKKPAILATDDHHSPGDTMEFLLIGHDGTDQGALGRRLAVRERHLAVFDEFSRGGYFKYGCALLDDDETMVGSLVVCEFTSRRELEDLWLSQEPYVLGGVWKTTEIRGIRTRRHPARQQV
jgi:uncharacterized protein YciI